MNINRFWVLLSDDKTWYFALEVEGFECVIRVEDAFQCHRKKDAEAMAEYANSLDSSVHWSVKEIKESR